MQSVDKPDTNKPKAKISKLKTLTTYNIEIATVVVVADDAIVQVDVEVPTATGTTLTDLRRPIVTAVETRPCVVSNPTPFRPQ